MNLDKYIDERLEKENISKELFWKGYEDFKIGAFIKEAREANGMTQTELASRVNTTKSTISRMENHANDTKISTLEKVAKALGKQLKISIV
jgi:ribosome-binding protein aMBF1 (putative translation factor)